MKKLATYGIQLVREGTVRISDKKAESAGNVASIVRAFLGGEPDREHFLVLLIDCRQNVIGINHVSIGTLSASLVHPREVFKAAVLANAAAVIISHNHPSGEVDPSAEDKDATRRLVRAGEIMGIPVVDHVIVSADKHFSFRDAGLI